MRETILLLVGFLACGLTPALGQDEPESPPAVEGAVDTPAAEPPEAPEEPPAPGLERPADEPPPETPVLDRVTVLVENDKFAGTDRFYTNGFKLAYQRNDIGLISRVMSDFISLVPFLKAEPLAYGIVFGHNIYTPEDTEQRLLIPRDRPYGAWLYGGFSITRGNQGQEGEPPPPFLFQDRIEVLGGVIGTAAQGEQVQNNFHRLINVDTSKGWHNQLKSEFGLQVYMQRKWLLRVWREEHSGIGADFLPHFGAAIGNVFTHASIGGTFRFGINLGDDFGPVQRIASAGLDTLSRPDSLRLYVFGRIEGRGVLFNAFLDGNLFRGPVSELSVNGVVETHDINRERFVADFEAGIVAQIYWLSVGFTSVTRTREFEEQRDTFTFGAVHVSATF